MVRQWLLALVVLLFATPSLAEEYYWLDSRSVMNPNAPHYSSAEEACSSICRNTRLPRSRFEQTSNGPNIYTGFCNYYDPKVGLECAANYVRKGDSCDNGRVWHQDIGGCKCPEGQQENAAGICAEPKTCETGQELLTRGSDAPATTVSGRVYILSSPPSAVCSAGCQYISTSSKAASCYLVSGSTDTGFCNYSVTSDGERCSGEDAPEPDVGDPPNPEEPPDSPTQPTDPDDPGCPAGQSWSGTACVTEPTDDGGGADGGDSGDGEDDGSSGDPCDIEGDCWEEDDGGSGNGSGNGSGTGSGNGSGDGEGSGDGIGDDDGEEDGEGECDPNKGYVCGGGKGPESGLNAPDAGSWDKANEEWDQRLEDAKQELKDKVKANVNQMKSAFDLQLSAGGGQLPCDTFTVWGKQQRFCVADYADQLSNLRLALLLMAAVIAALIILKE